MDKEKLTKELRKLNDEINGGIISRNKAIENHLDDILRLRTIGVPMAKIAEAIDVGISTETLSSTITRAKKKKNKIPPAEKAALIEKKEGAVGKEITQAEIQNWMVSTSADNERLIKRLINHGYTIDDVNSWKCSNSIQINKRLQDEIRKSKYKE